MMKPRRRVFRLFAVAILVIVAAAIVAWAILSKPRPTGVPGPDAERIASEMLRAVNADEWKETGAVRFTFLGHHHLWDRRRNYDKVEWRNHTVLLRIGNRTGRAWEKEMEVSGQRADDLVQKAYSLWINDSFWLNPVVKIYDQGVTRSIVRDAGGQARLLVEYSSGGLTPGDAYLWTPGSGGMPPTGWRIWAHTLTIKGLPSSWENWTTLSSGAKISTLHRIGPWRLRIADVAGARSLAKLLGTSADPFAPLSR